MRRLIIVCAAATGLVMAGALASQPAQAMSGTAPAGLTNAVEATNVVDQVRRRRYYRYRYYRPYRWGHYRSYRPYAFYYRPYRYRYYRAYRPWGFGWGWRRRWW